MEGRVEEAHEHGEPHGDDHAHGHPHDAAARQVHPLLHQVGLAQHEGGVGEHEAVAGAELDGVEGDGQVGHLSEALLHPPVDLVALSLLWMGWYHTSTARMGLVVVFLCMLNFDCPLLKIQQMR